MHRADLIKLRSDSSKRIKLTLLKFVRFQHRKDQVSLRLSPQFLLVTLGLLELLPAMTDLRSSPDLIGLKQNLDR